MAVISINQALLGVSFSSSVLFFKAVTHFDALIEPINPLHTKLSNYSDRHEKLLASVSSFFFQFPSGSFERTKELKRLSYLSLLTDYILQSWL